MASYERVLVLAPTHPHALSGLAQLARAACDWARTGRLAEDLKMAVEQDSAVVQPFVFLSYWDDAALQRHCAENYLRHVVPSTPPSLWHGAPYRHDKIRIAYLSADFRASAAGYLLAELFERHDRARFELTAISFGPDDGSALRARLVKAFDRFSRCARPERPCGGADAAQSANRYRDRSDGLYLGCASRNSELASLSGAGEGILGYPGTLAADFIDYVIADKVVLPEGQQRFFTENIVHLPGSYYPAGAHHASGEPARSEAGLPEQGFVFCCFNAHWKITARIFDVWMRLLARTPGSVLWLLAGQSRENLCREAAAMGIDADRLIFAARKIPDLIWRVIVWQTCSSIRFPITHIPRRSTRYGPDCRSSPAGARPFPPGLPPACWRRSTCPNWSRPISKPMRAWRENWRTTPRG